MRSQFRGFPVRSTRSFRSHYRPEAGQGCACDGKITSLTLKYLGIPTINLVIKQNNGTIIYTNATLASGTTFTFVGLDNMGTMGPEISLFISTVLHIDIHTSCSEPIHAGLIFGDFEIITGFSKNGGEICESHDGNCPPGSVPDCAGVCDGPSILDCAGVCYNPSNPAPNLVDCYGVCYNRNDPPPHIPDCAGVCFDRNNPPTNVPDCAGVCNGDAVFDCNHVCDGGAFEDCGKNCIVPCVTRFKARNRRQYRK